MKEYLVPEVCHDMPEGCPVQHQGGGHQPVVGQHRLHQAQAHTSSAQQHLHLVTEIYYILQLTYPNLTSISLEDSL